MKSLAMLAIVFLTGGCGDITLNHPEDPRYELQVVKVNDKESHVWVLDTHTGTAKGCTLRIADTTCRAY